MDEHPQGSGGFGGPYTSGPRPSAAIIYARVFASRPVLNAQSGEARYSVDAFIERRVSWYRIAEVGHRAEPHRPVGRTASAAVGATD